MTSQTSEVFIFVTEVILFVVNKIELKKMFEHTKNVPRVTSFGELTKQVHLINDLILADMACGRYRNNIVFDFIIKINCIRR